jgi:hypothetical protein
MDNFLIVEKFNLNNMNKQLLKKIFEKEKAAELKPVIKYLPIIDNNELNNSKGAIELKHETRDKTENKKSISLNKDRIVIPKRFVNLKLPSLGRNPSGSSPLLALGDRSGSSHFPEANLDRPLNILKKKIVIKRSVCIGSSEIEKGNYVVKIYLYQFIIKPKYPAFKIIKECLLRRRVWNENNKTLSTHFQLKISPDNYRLEYSLLDKRYRAKVRVYII